MSNRTMAGASTAMVAAILWVLGGTGAYAQAGEDDVGELAGMAGGAFGGASGTQPVATGSAGLAFSRHGMIFVDTLYMPLGNRTIEDSRPRAAVHHSHLLDFSVDFHIRFPIHERWAPYTILGTGLLWNFLTADAVNRRGVPGVHHFDEFKGAFHTGAGLRYYVRPTWGIRPEVKVIVSNHVYTVVSFGVFWVAPTYWP
jgi:hypothetical protein